ncbi:MAG: MmgE/PrpD family protein [Candidatus Lambdaproteobacteria bacterium]|nr:MmgE/PrpD family protein [Candidatus Lambdaproteobacteria bacterium]
MTASQQQAAQAIAGARPARPETPIAETLAGFAVELTCDAIPEPVRERAKHLMLDAVGIALASTRWEFAHKALTAVRGLGGSGECSLIGLPDRLPLRDAVLMNALLVHGLDYDDTHLPGVIHATASAFPCALGVAEHTGASGRDLLAAYVVGIEAGTRVSAAARGGFHHVGFHPTGLIGHFLCALVAGRLLGANRQQLAMAQGIALSTASGSQEFLQDGAWTKRIHPGWAGVGGITAAALARQGFIAPRLPYEGRYGLFASHLGPLEAECDYALATAGLGRQWEMDKVAVKPYPACHFTHANADSALALRRDHGLKPEEIAKVRVLVPEQVIPVVCEPVANKRRPVSDYDAKFSVQFIVAASFVRGRFGLAELEPQALSDPDILRLADRVEYEVYPDHAFPQAYSGGVIVTTRAGREHRHLERINRGAAERPLANAEIADKFMQNAGLAVSPRRAAEIRDALLGLENFQSAWELAEILRGA